MTLEDCPAWQRVRHRLRQQYPTNNLLFYQGEAAFTSVLSQEVERVRSGETVDTGSKQVSINAAG